jgi:N-acetyl-anhydromuramyl-L-alanine amidase AmpD
MVKVSQKYNIERKYIKKGKARSGQSLVNGGVPDYSVAHETANNKADAMDHFDYFNDHQPEASAQTFIDAVRILEIVPIWEKAWHNLYSNPEDNRLFGEDANDTAIGVELCRTGIFAQAYDRYTWYFAYLCIKFGWDPYKKIVPHSKLDPRRRSDPMSWLAPNGISWGQFLADVSKYIKTWNQEIDAAANVSGDQYKIRKGDTFWGISRELGIDLDKLVKANHGTDPNTLQPGQLINLPEGSVAKKEDPPVIVKDNTKHVRLPSTASTWRTYRLNVRPVKENSDWSLTPARYGGLTYEILGNPYPHVVTVMTGRGKRNIYVHPSTGAVIR